jgi:hypothetical protein
MVPQGLATIWLGPVSLQQVSGATVPDRPATSVTCTGDGSPSCGQIADGWTDASGRKLPALLNLKGLAAEAIIAAAAFSAGGSILKRLCLDPRDRAQLRVVHSADASYEATKGPDGPAPVEGYIRYAQEALSDPTKLFVATASANPNKTFGSGIDVLRSTRLELQRRTGVIMPQVPTMPGLEDLPGTVYQMGNVWMAEYPTIQHAQQATQLAPKIWQALIVPWLAGSPGAPPAGPPSVPPVEPPPLPQAANGGTTAQHLAAFVGGVLIGYGALRLLSDRW